MRQLDTSQTKRSHSKQELPIDYEEAERQLLELLFDTNTNIHSEKQATLQSFAQTIERVLAKAFPTIVLAIERRTCGSQLGQRFLQRVLYHLERTQLSDNQQFEVLRACKSKIETVWQQWELSHIELDDLKNLDVIGAISDRMAEDVNPPLSETADFFRKKMSQVGYQQLMAIATFKEACLIEQYERTIDYLCNRRYFERIYRWFQQESENNSKEKHLLDLAQILNALEMQPEPTIYFDIVPWEVLAAIEQNFLLIATPDRFLRYLGSLLYTEIATPSIFSSYHIAAERLNLPMCVQNYWEIQAKPRVQLVHQILEDMARIAETHPCDDIWQMLWGYDQQKLINTRALAATARAVRAAQRAEQPNSRSSKLARRKRVIL